MEILNNLKNIFSETLKIPLEEVSDTTSPNTCASWDSFNMMKLIIVIEKEFKVTIGIEEIIAINNFCDVVSLIEEKIN